MPTHLLEANRLVELTEGGPALEWELAAHVVHVLVAAGIITAVGLGGDRWLITPKTKVGSMSIDGVTVRVRPKLPVDQIVFMLGYAKDPGWMHSPVEFAPHDEFVQAMADAFVRQATNALSRGAIQGYRETEAELPVLRGRLREQEQLRRRFGIALPLLVRYDEYTVDIAENRILRAATERLLRLSGLRQTTVSALRSLRMNLADVEVLAPGMPLPHWRRSRLNERYVPALGLAEIVLGGTSFSHDSPDDGETGLVADGFMVEMSTVFEAFVTTALGRDLEAKGGRCRTQYPTSLDEHWHVRMEADLVWSKNDVPFAVADAKYKAEKPSGFANADVYQMLAYCTALKLPVGHLVYAKGNEPQITHAIRNVDVTIHAHTLDLTLPPSKLLEQVSGLANRIEASATEQSAP